MAVYHWIMRSDYSWLRYFLIALVVFLFLRLFIFDFSGVRDNSMQPALRHGETVLVARAAYRFRLPFGGPSFLRHSVPRRGDIVIFTIPGEEHRLVKRVVALPGDRLEWRNRNLLVNGTNVRFFRNRFTAPFPPGPYRVPAGHVFVLGDNTDNSIDSMDFGAVAEERILGRAVFRFTPLARMGKVR